MSRVTNWTPEQKLNVMKYGVCHICGAVYGGGIGMDPGPRSTLASAPCPNGECDGSGKIVDKLSEGKTWVDIGNGLQTRFGGGYSSRLCSCRKSLPKRDGTASWWGSNERVFEQTVEFAMFDEYATLSVGVETCISEDNYLVHRTRENAYYPPIAHLEVSDTDLTWLLPDDLRRLAAMLLAAADKCDEIEPEDAP